MKSLFLGAKTFTTTKQSRGQTAVYLPEAENTRTRETTRNKWATSCIVYYPHERIDHVGHSVAHRAEVMYKRDTCPQNKFKVYRFVMRTKMEGRKPNTRTL